ncbi:hypothetical protein CDL15_Pgr000557 [Punica granatum]|uniref:Uncharacterized protein n=1 Tax=Punica granatum TaxID=22663 RepID=A0A218W2V7_PUNGR|nr:hypothetical protein CDL15_Pgr000557 [Punica granatum]PKI51451.1 hypothetical protein CRG98_028162 [Punica granatum]
MSAAVAVADGVELQIAGGRREFRSAATGPGDDYEASVRKKVRYIELVCRSRRKPAMNGLGLKLDLGLGLEKAFLSGSRVDSGPRQNRVQFG